MPKTAHYKTYSLRLPEETAEALQNMALAKGVPISELGRQAVDEYIAKYAGEILQELAADAAKREQAARDLLAYVGVTPDSDPTGTDSSASPAAARRGGN